MNLNTNQYEIKVSKLLSYIGRATPCLLAEFTFKPIIVADPLVVSIGGVPLYRQILTHGN